MENETTVKPGKGTWAKMTNEEKRAPKVSFELNKTEIVTFLGDPRESVNEEDGSAYYTFDVTHDDIQTVIQTSAWTLLNELAKYHPLQGKKLAITKKMLEKGKQFFTVTTI